MFVDRRHVKRSDVGGWGLGTAVVHTWRTRWRGGECHGVAVVSVRVCLRVRARREPRVWLAEEVAGERRQEGGSGVL